jgi:hypothetical protein
MIESKGYGTRSNGSRKLVANMASHRTGYAPGRPVEIDYVIQRHRPKPFDGGSETEVVAAIRVAAEPGVAPDGVSSRR